MPLAGDILMPRRVQLLSTGNGVPIVVQASRAGTFVSGSNGGPRFDWAASTADHWLDNADRLEAQLVPISELLFSRAGLTPSLSVLDVGCGRGSTTRAAATLIGKGRAIGLDLSAEMISGARDLDVMDTCTWIAGDATDADLGQLEIDVVISRFGLMFFAEPVRAMANVRSALRPGGRVVAVAWQ
jgi:SAM-dependent methyltransferase